MSAVGWGLMLTAVVTAVLVTVWGRAALLPAVAFGLLATAIQQVAWTVVRPALDAPFPSLMKRWGIGMGLRVLGVVVFAAAVLADRELFPPLPTALAYLGVLIPLLFMETRRLR